MPKKALIVDNNYFFVKFLSELLEKRGYSVIKAYDGMQGIANLEEGPVDIVFADLIMPKIDVRQFIEFIRTRYQAMPFPIVALSGTVIEQLGELDEGDLASESLPAHVVSPFAAILYNNADAKGG